MQKRGIDVSHNNGNVDWQAVKNAGFGDFAIIRMGYGGNYTSQDDTQFINNINKCESLGIPYGVYLYSYALDLGDVQSEVDHVLRLLKNVGKNFKYGVWLDMEDADGYKSRHGMPSNSTLVDICYNFCLKVEQAGYYCGIYANLDWLKNKLNSSKLDRFDKWVAQWAKKCTYTKSYSIWQNTSSQMINGRRFDANKLINDFATSGPTTSTEPSKEPNYTGKITYQSYDNKKDKWLPEVNSHNTNDYAGNLGNPMGGLRADSENGEILIQAHIKGRPSNEWLDWISSKDYLKNDKKNGKTYSGIMGKDIDKIRIRSTVGYVDYCAYDNVKKKWLPWVRSTDENEHAGNEGHPIGGIQMK